MTILILIFAILILLTLLYRIRIIEKKFIAFEKILESHAFYIKALDKGIGLLIKEQTETKKSLVNLWELLYNPKGENNNGS